MNTWAEAMKAIGALEDRVSELEHVVAFGQRNDSASLTHDGRIVVSANEYARLERVDNEAREFMRWLGSDAIRGLTRESSIMTGLREALKR